MCPPLSPMPAWSAAVLIRSLSTLRCDPSQSWRSGSFQAGTDRNAHREVPGIMLAELVDHVIGVDPDRDWITVALIEARTSGVLATDRFPADSGGYRDVVEWADANSAASERAWVVEGTASYGRGLTVMLQRGGESSSTGPSARRPETAPSPTL